MTYLELWFIGLPLILIVVPAVITVARQDPKEKASRFQMFFVWLAAYSMCVAALGFFGTIVVHLLHSGIPGTASDGGNINGQYYFNWHDETRTEVSKQTWQRAYFLEQLTARSIWVAVSVFVASFLLLFLTRSLFQPSTPATKGSTTDPHYEKTRSAEQIVEPQRLLFWRSTV